MICGIFENISTNILPKLFRFEDTCKEMLTLCYEPEMWVRPLHGKVRDDIEFRREICRHKTLKILHGIEAWSWADRWDKRGPESFPDIIENVWPKESRERLLDIPARELERLEALPKKETYWRESVLAARRNSKNSKPIDPMWEDTFPCIKASYDRLREMGYGKMAKCSNPLRSEIEVALANAMDKTTKIMVTRDTYKELSHQYVLKAMAQEKELTQLEANIEAWRQDLKLLASDNTTKFEFLSAACRGLVKHDPREGMTICK